MKIQSTGLAGRRPLLLAGAAAFAFSIPTAALAQDAGSEEESANDFGNEIVVTATKREQTLQETPISVSVTSGETIEQAQIRDVLDLQTVAPSLRVSQLQNSSSSTFIIRGFGNGDNNFGIEPSVGVFIDGVFRSRSAAALGDLPNVQRIEVLNGPQSTLFGKNASAGVVNIVTKRPSAEFGGYIDIGLFEDDERRVKASLDAPISESLRTRTTVTWGEFDGYIDNISTTAAGGKLNGYDRKGIRTVWVADATEKVQLTFIADYRESDDNCCVEVIGAPNHVGAPTARPPCIGHVRACLIHPEMSEGNRVRRAASPAKCWTSWPDRPTA